MQIFVKNNRLTKLVVRRLFSKTELLNNSLSDLFFVFLLFLIFLQEFVLNILRNELIRIEFH